MVESFTKQFAIIDMSHLLKRTKKSCLKFIRKISSKQIFLKRLEEDDFSADNDFQIDKNNPVKDRTSCFPSTLQQTPSSSPASNATYPEKRSKPNQKCKETDDAEDDEETTPTHQNKVLQSLTSKLFLTADGYEFQRLEQLRSDTASEIIPYECSYAHSIPPTPPLMTTSTLNLRNASGHQSNEVVFEKVKYKENVRYLRHTPSTNSLDNLDDFENLQSVKEEEESENINPRSEFKNSKNPFTAGYKTISNCNTTRGLEEPIMSTAVQTHTGHYKASSNHCNDFYYPQKLPVNVSLGSKSNGNYQNLIIKEELNNFYKLTPIVKWDINGNSLEDDDDMDDIRLKELYDFSKNSLANSNANDNHRNFDQLSLYSPAKSLSLRSSSTTLETWLDDDWSVGGVSCSISGGGGGGVGGIAMATAET